MHKRKFKGYNFCLKGRKLPKLKIITTKITRMRKFLQLIMFLGVKIQLNRTLFEQS